MNVKWGDGRPLGVLQGLSSSSYRGAYTCVTSVGGDEDVEHESVRSRNVRLSLATREWTGDESCVCSPVDSASSLKPKGVLNHAASSPSGDSSAFVDLPEDSSFLPPFMCALTSPLSLAASNTRIASSSERKL